MKRKSKAAREKAHAKLQCECGADLLVSDHGLIVCARNCQAIPMDFDLRDKLVKARRQIIQNKKMASQARNGFEAMKELDDAEAFK